MTGTERYLSRVLVGVMTLQAILGLVRPDAYRDAGWIRATWFGNDLITLCVAAPMLGISSAQAAGGAARARLVWLGVAGYAMYNYAFYLLGAALNVYFPIYIAAVLVSAATLGAGLVATDRAALARCYDGSRRVRAIGVYYVFVAVGLSVVWLGTWFAHIAAGRPTPVETEVFKLVAALDMTLLVPPLAAGGVLLWRRSAWGFVVAPLAGVQGTLYLLVLAVNSGVAILRGLAVAPGELPVWGSLLVPTGLATALLIRACRMEAARARRLAHGRRGQIG